MVSAGMTTLLADVLPSAAKLLAVQPSASASFEVAQHCTVAHKHTHGGAEAAIDVLTAAIDVFALV
jgi:hypothetical protein